MSFSPPAQKSRKKAALSSALPALSPATGGARIVPLFRNRALPQEELQEKVEDPDGAKDTDRARETLRLVPLYRMKKIEIKARIPLLTREKATSRTTTTKSYKTRQNMPVEVKVKNDQRAPGD